jgi:predicted RNase H-related nuclease YkuK (DUF458 family)
MIKRAFKLEGGETVDLVTHVNEIMRTKDVTEVIVGTDSQNKRYNTTYVTTVVFKYFGRGAHYIYQRENVKKIKDRFDRLWGEVERSLEVAMFLENKDPETDKIRGTKVDFIELDFNKKELTGSNSMIKASAGYVTGMGFKCKVKPDDGLSAVKAADHLCRR